MADNNEYSFILGPESKIRHIAGPFDVDARKPHYEIDISIANHVHELITIEQFLTGPENCQLGWNIINKSSYPAFVIIKEDGKLLKYT